MLRAIKKVLIEHRSLIFILISSIPSLPLQFPCYNAKLRKLLFVRDIVSKTFTIEEKDPDQPDKYFYNILITPIKVLMWSHLWESFRPLSMVDISSVLHTKMHSLVPGIR